MFSQFDIKRVVNLRQASEHEQKSARYARSGDEIVEWINPVDGCIVQKFRKQDPPLIKHKSGFTKAFEHKIRAIDLRADVARLDQRRANIRLVENKPWGRAQRILYNRGYRRFEDSRQGYQCAV